MHIRKMDVRKSMKAIFFSMMATLLALLLPATVLAQSEYTIRPGDTLQIEVLQDSSLNRQVLVLPDGQITFPFAGQLRAGGRTPEQVSQTVADAIGPNFATRPNVFVAVASLRERQTTSGTSKRSKRTVDIYILGEVQSAGPKEVDRKTTFLQALSLSGGFTNFAAPKRIQLRRQNSRTGEQALYIINYKALSDGAKMENNIVLQDGDVILVPERRLFE